MAGHRRCRKIIGRGIIVLLAIWMLAEGFPEVSGKVFFIIAFQ